MPVATALSRIVSPYNSWFLPRTALFCPEGEGGSGAGGEGNEDPDGDEPGDAGDEGDEGKDDDGKQKKKPLVTLERHKSEVNKLKAKLKEYEDADSERKRQAMSETEKLQAEKRELEKKIAGFEADGKKLDALAKAKKALAKDGLVVDPAKEDTLNRSIRKLAFDEDTLDDDVAELVQMATMPKGSGHRSVAGKAPKSDDSDRDPLTYTGKELGEIHKESPERYRAIMDKRKQAIAAKANSGK